MLKKRSKEISQSFAYGLHTVMAIMDHQPERCKKLYIARKSDVLEVVKKAQNIGLQFEKVDRAWLEKKFQIASDAQGLVLECSPFTYATLSNLLDAGAKRLLVMDSIKDVVNLGRAARAALAFGVDGILIVKDRSAPINAAAEKSAVGALSRIQVARVTNLASALRTLKDAGFFIYGADISGSVSLKECDFAAKAAVVIGQEGEGLRELTKKCCDIMVNIPMESNDICLNAADTALLFLFEMSQKRK